MPPKTIKENQSATKISRLQYKINACFERIKSIHESTSKLNESGQIDAFLSSAFAIENIRTTFLQCLEERDDIFDGQDDSVTPDYNTYIAFEDMYSAIKYKVDELSRRSDATNSNITKLNNDSKLRTKPKLPRLELCSFNGDIQNWAIFYENFRTLIHENPDLTDGERIQYLVSKLTDSAKNICQGILPSAENYKVLWCALVNKYNDKRLLGVSYLDKLFEIPSVNNASASNLELFVDKFSALTAAIKQLDIDNVTDFIYIYIACKKLDADTVRLFELSIRSDEKSPTVSQFIEFMREQSRVLRRAHTATKPPRSNTNINNSATTSRYKPQSTRPTANYTSKTFVNVTHDSCILCNKTDHSNLYRCPTFINNMTPNERFDLIKTRNLCINCLSSKHISRQCKSTSHCSKCYRRHHTMLHFNSVSHPVAPSVSSDVLGETASPAQANPAARSSRACVREPLVTDASIVPQVQKSPATTASIALCARSIHLNNDITRESPAALHPLKTTVLLGTALCYVVRNGKTYVLRALIDNASQKDIITSECCKRLNLKITPSTCNRIAGVGDITSSVEGTASLTIRSRLDCSVRFDVHPYVVKHITSELPITEIDTSQINYLNNIPLADPKYNKPADIDLILGADVFARILKTNIISGTPGKPVAIETSLGYLIIGEAPIIGSSCHVAQSYCTLDTSFENIVNRFFALEDVPNVVPLTADEQECELMYRRSVTRDSEGRYVVTLPFKDDPSKLGDSLQTATRRFYALERKLCSNQSLKLSYDNVFIEYLNKGYLKPVTWTADRSARQFVIPHHAVVRTDKSTTKLRVVLDASAKTTSALSLNDLLHTGPNLQNDLFNVMLNFRLFPIALNADIRQMYLRILMNERDTCFQRVLYRFNQSEPLQMYELTRVPFGLCCSPYLAIRTVRQLALDEGHRFPAAAAVATTDIYMDDLATSCTSVSESIELSKQLIELFLAGGFELVKFSCNSSEVMASLPVAHRVSDSVDFSPESHLKILGLRWLPSDDVFSFSVNSEIRQCTKRNILSTIARLWDLMGFVAPVTLLAKLIIKSLWEDKVDWDEGPPKRIVDLWQQFESELPLLGKLKLPRHVGVTSNCVISVLGFADASEKAYGGVVYLHVQCDYRHSITLVCAKSRVAPLRNVSLARLELCGNVILAKLMRVVIDTYSKKCKINNVIAFTDSTVALAWIHSAPARWQTFVANRVAMIHDNIDASNFYHIPGKDNPADCLSRGLMPAQLIDHPLWFSGPRFARLPFEEWPMHRFDVAFVDGEIPERKVKVLTTTVTTQPLLYCLSCRVSSWPKLLRIVTYILRFIKKIPRKFETSHLEIAEKYLIKSLQTVYLSDEIKNITLGRRLSLPLRKLNAFLEDGILRVGGRLRHADLPHDSRYPILLPRRDHMVNLIIDYYHKKHLHTGPQLLMCLLRQKYWILSARNIVRKRVQMCNICFRSSPKAAFPLMADLPAVRVQEAKAFCHTGVDYAGPLQIIPHRRRGVRSQKAYICLFVCLVTKAVHIELASDLSTACFLNAFKRFLSRRGPVTVVYSDCGTNFIGAKTYLDSVYRLLESDNYRDNFTQDLQDNNITWKFNPPSAPHFGGIWESNVRSVKTHLARVVGTQLLTFEEMLTVLVQIECLLNSRPLSVLSSDPSDPQALTPAHFLTLTPLRALPVEDLSGENATNLVQRKRMVDHIIQSFWKRWKVEYLNTLQSRKKWTNSVDTVQKGDVVLIKTDNSAPLNWPLGIVENTFPGSDGVVRVAEVRTRAGMYRRPVVKLCPLPTQ